MSGQALYDDVLGYCELGEHRTGSEDDLETADWLYRSLQRARIDVKRYPFELAQFILEGHQLQVDGDTHESFPLWPPRVTEQPLSAPLRYVSDPHALPDLHGCVAVVDIVPSASLTQDNALREILKSVGEAGAAAILAVTPHPSGELVALNATGDLNREPSTLPALVIGTRTRDQ